MTLELMSKHKCFDGWQLRYKHHATSLNCDMHFSIYLPPQAEHSKVPVIYWLSGLTCTDENFVTKAGAQQYAAKYGIAIVAPDTSPRGDDVADDPEGCYDFGLGAGFYLNATQEPYSKHYHMYDYIVEELPKIINAEFPIESSKVAISGHSMGGHGAITIGLKNPELYGSISAFAPICAPMDCPWGQKAFTGYLGSNPSDWRHYDATELLRSAATCQAILIDQGADDTFLAEQLKPESFIQLAKDKQMPVHYSKHPGYDHSYFFISSFIEKHLHFHHQHFTQGFTL